MKDPRDPCTAELTFADLSLPKKRGRPALPESEKLTPAERARRYREKRRAAGVRLVPVSRDEAFAAAPALEEANAAHNLAARLKGKFE